MGIKGRRVHLIEELSDTIISFQRGKNLFCCKKNLANRNILSICNSPKKQLLITASINIIFIIF